MVNSMTGKKETESKATVQTDSQAMAQDIGLGEVENLFNNWDFWRVIWAVFFKEFLRDFVYAVLQL